MRETLTSSPELFSDISWNLLLLGEETAKKWDHSEFNIEHIIHTLFSSSEFFAFIEKLSIDQDTVLDITEDFLEETPTNESDIFTIGEDLEILLDNPGENEFVLDIIIGLNDNQISENFLAVLVVN